MTVKKAAYQKTDLSAKIVRLADASNDRRPGTKAHERLAAVLRSNGKTVEAAVKAGAKPSTVRHAVEAKLIRLVKSAPKKTAKKVA